jgi:potassium channel subfamily K
MGDTIIKGIRDLTLWLGTVTVLPGEKNKKDMLGIGKAVVANIFNRKVHEDQSQSGKIASSCDQQRIKTEPEQLASTATLSKKASHPTTQEPNKAAYRKRIEKDIEKGKVHYHLILVKEIAEVIKHVNAKPAKEYSYDEWTWYLKLAGEEDTAALFNHQKHRRASNASTVGENRVNNETQERDQPQRRTDMEWTWLSESSPLMGKKCETEWILDKLTKSLQREMESTLKAQSDQFDRGISEGNGIQKEV